MKSFENPIDSAPSEKYSRSERNIERKRERFTQEIEEKAKTLGMSPEEYLAAYAKNENDSRERAGKGSVNATKKLFELGSASSAEMNNILHDKTGLQIELEHQRELATRDPLTGLLNRRAFEEEINKRQANIRKLEEQPRGASDKRIHERRHKEPVYYSIMFIDADKFKSINTEYGHDIGDIVLKGIAETIQKNTRETSDGPEGVVARWGGEEMIVLVPVNIDSACKIADRIRQAVEEKKFLANGKEFGVTISIGIAPYNKHADQQIKTADMAVQAAKGDFKSVQLLADELGITVQSNTKESTRNQVQFVKDNTLSKYQTEKH